MRRFDNKSYRRSMPNVIETAPITEVIDIAMGMIERIKEARAARGWSQAVLAEKSGVSQPAIQKIEKGQTRQSRFLPAILQALDLPLTLLSSERDLSNAGSDDASRMARVEEARRLFSQLSDDRQERILAMIEDAVLLEGPLKDPTAFPKTAPRKGP